MKKIITLIVAILLAVSIPAQVYACDCNCPCCNKSKTAQTAPSKKVSLKQAAEKEIKSLNKKAKKYGWKLEKKKVTKNIKGKYYVRVKYVNKKHRTYSVLYLHTKLNGEPQVTWHYKDLTTGKLEETEASLIEVMFKRVHDSKK